MTNADTNEIHTGSLEEKKLIYDYAWHWFSYHASQRMTVFRFFFLAATILAVGYYQTANHGNYWLSVGFALLLFGTTFLFWRLDTRTAELIKIGEDLLESFENQFGAINGIKITLIGQANSKHTRYTTRLFPNILYWPAPGSEDTELGVLMEPEVDHGTSEVYTRVQA
jgi:hypothetical protein